jgi:hypothetical protein
MSEREIEASLRALVEQEPVGREGDCVYCWKYLGAIIDDYYVEVEEWPRERLGKRQHDHKSDCPWDRARKTLEAQKGGTRS